MGAILDRLHDLQNTEVDIDMMRPELPEFTVTVDAAGTVTASAAQPTLKGYVLSIYGMQAWVAGGTVPGDQAPALVTFNVRETGRGQDVLRRAVRVAGFMEGQETAWFMPYRCMPGTDLEATWTVDTTWAAQINAQRVFGVRLVADYYKCR